MHSFDRAKERALSASLKPMIQALAKHDAKVLNLPYTIKLSGKSPPLVEIKATDHHKFAPIPENELIALQKTNPEDPDPELLRNDFEAPCYIQLSWWASSLAQDCNALTWLKQRLEDDFNFKDQYAGYSRRDSEFGDNLLTQFLDGQSERSVCGVRWYVTAFLEMAPFNHGAILATHPMERLNLSSTRILRSELLTLLASLRTTTKRAVLAGTPCTTPTAFVLSFTYDQIRVLEASIKTSDEIDKIPEIHVSVRSLFDGFPAGEERNKLWRELMSWTMLTEDYNKHSYTGLPIRSAISIRSASTATKTTTTDSVFSEEEHSNNSSPNSSFVRDRDEEYEEDKE
ncbi:hypothetical protein F4680DRAFT_199585 [Xylaria scruposa]|nr:hypothetical protein F4680DRAFT_199585 [Xylaria scruposa]